MFCFFLFHSAKLISKSHLFCGYSGLQQILQCPLVLAGRNILYRFKLKTFSLNTKGSFQMLLVCLPAFLIPWRTCFFQHLSSPQLYLQWSSLLRDTRGFEQASAVGTAEPHVPWMHPKPPICFTGSNQLW